MDQSSFSVVATELELERGELPPEQILDGTPVMSERTLWTSRDRGQEGGVWEITPGVVTDIEADEMFVVLSGRATVEIADGPTLHLRPGVVGAFTAGARTIWRVEETLRKVYSVTIS